jgi:hypothetical protein
VSVETISGVVAAVAAVGAVYFARDTVQQSIEGRKDADKHHDAQIAEMKAATVASAEQHRIEMKDRNRLAEADKRNQQLMQLDRVAELLRQIADVARDEHRNHPEPLAPGHTGSKLPIMCMRLENALHVLVGLDLPNPPKTYELAETRGRLSPILSVGDAVDALYEIQQLTLDVGAGQVQTTASAPTGS